MGLNIFLPPPGLLFHYVDIVTGAGSSCWLMDELLGFARHGSGSPSSSWLPKAPECSSYNLKLIITGEVSHWGCNVNSVCSEIALPVEDK